MRNRYWDQGMPGQDVPRGTTLIDLLPACETGKTPSTSLMERDHEEGLAPGSGNPGKPLLCVPLETTRS